MAGRISAVHRWCVTGTPIGPGGMADVLGLLRALHVAPFSERPSLFQVRGPAICVWRRWTRRA